MGNVAAIFAMVLRRSLAHWRLLATVIVGVVLSSALMSSVVLYSDTIRDLGLRHGLGTRDPFSLDIRILSSSHLVRRDEAELREKKTADLLKAHAGDIVEETVRYGRSATFFLAPPGATVPESDLKPRAHFQFLSDLTEHVRLVEGQPLPRAEPLRNAQTPPVLSVWIGKATADSLGVRTGDAFELHPYWKLEAAPVTVTVVGIIEPRDLSERYWQRKTDRFEMSTTWPTYPFFVGEEAFLDSLAVYLPDMDGTYETFGIVDTDRINSRNARAVEDRLNGLDGALREAIPRTSAGTELPSAIETYRTKLFFTRLPLFALMLQIVGIVLYYLVMVATMLIEKQAGEIALLRSRGASTLQVVAVFGIEGGVLCGAAAMTGPFIAAGAIAALGLTPPFDDLSGGSTLEVPFSSQAMGMALFGAGLAFSAILWPAYRAARNSVVDYKRQVARPQQQPVFLRYYLDLALVGAGAIAFYELRQRGSLVTDRLFGDLSADPLLLISPTLFMLMIALVFLRLFPVGLRVVARATRALDSPTITLGLSRMVRAPLHYSRLILLLLLATAVGMFAAGFRATLDRSYDDRADYAAGADGTLVDIRTPANQPVDAFTEKIGQATGAADVVPVARLDGSYSLGQFQSADVDVLGVALPEFEQVAFWRGDFASRSFHDLLGELEQPPAEQRPGPEVPAAARYMGLWAQLPLPPGAAGFGIRLSDSTGAYWEYRLNGPQRPSPGSWQFFWADLARPVLGSPAQASALPRTLDSVYLRITGQPPQIPERIVVLIDDVQVTMAQTISAEEQSGGFRTPTIIEPLEDIDAYESITGATSVGEPGSLSRAELTGRQGRYGAAIAFTRQAGVPPIVGLRLRTTAGPLPVLVSQSLLDLAKKRPGDEIMIYVNRQYVRVRIEGSFDLFPTFDPEEGHLMVAELGALQSAATRTAAVGFGIFPNEAWLGRVPSGALEPAMLASRGVNAEVARSRETMRADQASDPLVAASWEGILFLSFGAVLALTALGFAVYVALASESRALEFAILRTMGYTSRQVLSLVTFEQCFVIAGGVIAGTLLGFPLGRLMIGYLGVTETGRDPLPPLVSEVSWPAVATVYALLALVFIGTIAALSTVYSRLAVHRALRIGEL